MNFIRILALTGDNDYARALGKALMLKDPIFQVDIASYEEFQMGILEKETNKDNYCIFILDEELKGKYDFKSLGLAGLKKIIWIGDSPNIDNEENFIYKYGGLSSISSEIKMTHARITNRRRAWFLNNKAPIIGFTSAAGGVGLTSIAISTARELSLSGYLNILYISFEENESASVYINFDGGRLTIGEYLYYLFARPKSEIWADIDSFVLTDIHGFSAFRPAKGINELSRLDCDQQLYFLKSLTDSLKFNYIFMDFPFRPSSQFQALAESCKRIFLIDDGSYTSMYKNQELVKNLSPNLISSLKDRIIHVTNKWQMEKEILIDMDNLCIEYDPESFKHTSDFKININLRGQFGLGIRRIADELASQT